MEQIIAWVLAEGRMPLGRAADRNERSMARWLSARRREAAEGTLDPVKLKLLDDAVPGWQAGRAPGRPPRQRG